MSPRIDWTELSRQQQWLLMRLYGGGSLRNQNPEIISALQQIELIEEDHLSELGLAHCEHAIMQRAG